MTSKYKLISAALLSAALSPLVHAGPPTTWTAITYCDSGSKFQYVYAEGWSEKVECTTPSDTRINVPNNTTMNLYATVTRSKTAYKLSSEQIPQAGEFSIRRNVKWGSDSVFVSQRFSGSTNFSKKQTLGKTHTFFATVKSFEPNSYIYYPKVGVILSY